MDIKRLAQSKEKNIFTGVHMTVASLFSDMILIGVFMLAGFFVREIVKPIQKLFLPASLIGGLLALILGQQMLGLVEIPESFSKFSNVLIAPIMAALLFGVTINKKKVVGYMDYICVEQGIYGMQMAVGAALGALLAVLWPGLPKGWGTMGVFAFQGGHGNAGAAGQTYENLGIPENLSVGMVLATFGLIMAMLVGMVVVNIGVRKGWTKFVKDAQKQPDWYYGGVLPEEKRSSIGSTVTSSIGINHLALQGGWLLAAVYAGRLLIKAVGLVWPGVSVLPTVIQGILGGAIIWNLAKAVKLDRYIDVKTIKHVSGFLLEVVVLTAMATLDIELISTYIVIYTAICCALTLAMSLGFCKLFCKEEWFEKALMAFGVGTGNTATGLALVRAVDPDSNSSAPDNHGIYSAVMCWKEAFAGLVPMWTMSGIGMTVGVGGVMCAICIIVGCILFVRPSRKTA